MYAAAKTGRERMSASASEKGIHEVSFASMKRSPCEGYRAQNSANAVQKRASTYTSTAQPNRTAVAIVYGRRMPFCFSRTDSLGFFGASGSRFPRPLSAAK